MLSRKLHKNSKGCLAQFLGTAHGDLVFPEKLQRQQFAVSFARSPEWNWPTV